MDYTPLSIFPRTKIGRDHQLRDAFRHGKVIERKLDEKTGRPLVRVQYLDKQGLISYWLPIKQFGSRLTSHFYCPKIGDNVNINHLANGIENAFVDGSFFTENDPPPKDLDIDTRHFETEDKTIIEYREKDSTFLLDASKASHSATARAGTGSGGTVIVKAGLVQIEAGTIEETATEIIKLTAPEITEAGTTIIKLTAPEITLTGHMTFIGDITHTGNMMTSGVHTDANGLHAGMERDELRREVDLLKERVAILEQQVLMRLPLR